MSTGDYNPNPGNDPTRPGYVPSSSTPAASAARSKPVVTIVPDQPNKPLKIELVQGGWLGKYSGRIAWAIAGLCLLWAVTVSNKYKKYIKPDATITEQNYDYNGARDDRIEAPKKVAIITVEGAIMHQDGFAKQQIDEVRDDLDVAAVVLRVDSPGGTITGSNYLWHYLKELRTERKIPIVVSMGGICASGGYYISMCVGDEENAIFAEPTTWTGSIGVIIPHYDLSGALGLLFVRDDSIVSHPLKNAGSLTKRLTAEERALFQTLVDESFADFKAIVQEGRPKMEREAIDKVATGQIYTAKQALELGLVDKLGYLDDAVKRAIELSGVNANEIRAVKFAKPHGLFDEAFGSSGRAPAISNGQSGSALEGITSGFNGQRANALADDLIGLGSPRAYYLWTLWPSLLKEGN